MRRATLTFTGWGGSIDYPTTAGAYQTTHPGPSGAPLDPPFAAVISKLNANGSALLYSTYFGPFPHNCGDCNADTVGYGIAVDASGNAFITGAAPDSTIAWLAVAGLKPGAYMSVRGARRC
jgi:Beta-propeller repeat